MTGTQPPAVGMRCIRGYAPNGTPDQQWEWVLAGPGLTRACVIVDLTPTDEPTHVNYAYVDKHGHRGGPVQDSIENFTAGWRPLDEGGTSGLGRVRRDRELLIEFARWTLGQADPEGLAAVDALNVGTFESMADKFLDRERTGG